VLGFAREERSVVRGGNVANARDCTHTTYPAGNSRVYESLRVRVTGGYGAAGLYYWVAAVLLLDTLP